MFTSKVLISSEAQIICPSAALFLFFSFTCFRKGHLRHLRISVWWRLSPYYTLTWVFCTKDKCQNVHFCEPLKCKLSKTKQGIAFYKYNCSSNIIVADVIEGTRRNVKIIFSCAYKMQSHSLKLLSYECVPKFSCKNQLKTTLQF